jgi:acetyltransferase-like isoleucine patch superfamily enzyme
VLGNDVNLGAGTRLANFKIVPGTIAVRDPGGGTVDTGLRKFGALLGDGVQIGCNAVTSPGTVIGRESIVYPSASLHGTIPAGSVVIWRPDLVIRPRPQR